MTYCQRCGAQLEENARFCQKCGAPVVANTPPVISYAPPPPPPQTDRPVSREPIIILGLALLAILVIAIIVVVVLFAGFNPFNVSTTNPGNQNFNQVSTATQNLQTAFMAALTRP